MPFSVGCLLEFWEQERVFGFSRFQVAEEQGQSLGLEKIVGDS